MKVVLKKKDERKKLYFLGVLAAIVVYLLWPGSSESPVGGVSTRAVAPSGTETTTTAPGVPQRRGITARAGAEFRPRLRSNRPEDRIDPAKVDPTLRLDLLAKVQGVAPEGGSRNLFQFGAAAPVVPLAPIPKAPKVVINGPVQAAAPPPNPGPPPAPVAPPIPLKYYGFTNAKGEQRKRAFFLDGEDIIVAREGDTVKSRYKVVRIGVNSIEMEDTQFKSKQTLPLEQELAG